MNISGEDYPIFAFAPDTSFLCDGQIQGYYADPEADCQSFHICANLGDGGLTKYSLLCPNGTLFNQQYFICDWWFNVDCSLAESFYSLNEEIAEEQAANTPDGGDAGEVDDGCGYLAGRTEIKTGPISWMWKIGYLPGTLPHPRKRIWPFQ